MQGPQYIFCLQDKDYNFWGIDSSGNVVLTSQPYFLQFSPAGWNEVAIQNIVNNVYKGIDRSVSLPFGYLGDGAIIIKYIVYTLGANVPVFLTIASQQLEYVPTVSYKYWYKKIYRGGVDWKEFTHDSAKVTVTTLEDGLPRHLKANDKTVYEFPMDNPNAIFVKYDGIKLHESLNYIDVDGIDIQVGGSTNGQLLPCFFVNSEGNNTGMVIESQAYEVVPISSNVFADALDNNILYNAGVTAITVAIAGTREFTVTERTASSAGLRFWIGVGSNGTSVSSQALSATIGPLLGVTYTIPYSVSVTLQPGEYAFMYAISNIIGTSCSYQFTENSRFGITFTTRFQPTYIRAFRGQYLFGLLIAKITGNEYAAAVSAFLEQYKTFVFTSGNAIRGIEDATIKLSLDIFWKFWDSIFSVALITNGLTVDIGEETVMIDYDYIDLPEPEHKSFKVSFLNELFFNQLKIGFPEIRNEVGVLNGNDEVNSSVLFGTDSTFATGLLEKISTIRTSSYEQEQIRTATDGKNTTDFKNDNDVYAVHIEDELQPAVGDNPEHYNLDRELNALVTAGLLEPDTIFNLVFSPKRSINRQGASLRGRFWKSDSTMIYFRSGDKNTKMVCDGVVENADFAIGDLAAPVAYPWKFDFDAPVNQNPISLLELNPLRVFRFPLKGTYYTGLLQRISIQSATNKTQNIILRSTSTNDFTKLIKYTG